MLQLLYWKVIEVCTMIHTISAHISTDLSLPIEDPRIYTDIDLYDNWEAFKQTHKEMLKVYSLIITDFLSHSDGIDLVSLREKLIYEYYINKQAVDRALHFIMGGNAKDIQFEIGERNKPFIFRSPKQELPISSYCVYLPQAVLV
jgi:hypothetical protein